jgi:hypothetical protein
MADTVDKKVFDWMDQLEPEELIGLDQIEPFEVETPEDAVWVRIKQRTLAQLNHHEEGKEKRVTDPALPVKKFIFRFPFTRWIAAACAAVVLCAAVISSSQDVRAELRKMLQFIPGFGYVEQIDDSVPQAYVLPKPVEIEGEYGKVTVDAVLIQGGRGQIALSGSRVSAASIKTIIFSIEQRQYEFKQGSASWGNGGPWQAGFYNEGNIPLSGLGNAMIRFGDMVIGPLHLTQAKQADDLLGLGSSDLQNGIRITGVVTTLDENRSKVNLLTQLPGEQMVDSFGKEPITAGQQLRMVDGRGNTVEILKDNGFAKPSELLFEAPTGEAEHYQLTIPAIRIKDWAMPHQKVTLPIPVEGSLDIHVTLNIGGLPLDFTRVERINEKSVRFEVDVHFDATQLKTLQSYRLFTKDDATGMSYTTKMNENTKAIEMEWLDIIPGQKEISFYVGEPQMVIKGPWVLRNLQ